MCIGNTLANVYRGNSSECVQGLLFECVPGCPCSQTDMDRDILIVHIVVNNV